MKLGEIANYIVDRETDLGYILKDNESEYFLHHNECNGKHFKNGEEISAFLYTDKQRRVAATCYMPLVTINKGGLCEVVNRTETGAYVNVGISRDILLSSDDLPRELMPIVGDKICCKLKIKSNSLYIRLLTKNDILELQNNPEKLNIKQKVNGYVYRITDAGLNMVDEFFNIIFVYYKNLQKKYRIGEQIEVRISNITNDEYYGTTIEQKELVLEDDKEKIIHYLETHYGVIPFSENTDAEVIERVFNMSKSAFKRALGSLYKDRKILIEEKRIIYVNYINNKK